MFASIDIGTHSALLLIGDIFGDGQIRIVENRIMITNLGGGLSHGGLISRGASNRTIDVLQAYLKLCEKHDVKRIKAIGTAALREARNAKALLKRVKEELGLNIEVISAEKEARLTYEASARDFGKDITVVDVGGGSTELISGPPPLDIVSIPIGCVSLTEEFVKDTPVADEDEAALRNCIASYLCDDFHMDGSHSQEVVATAGTATTLLAMHFEIEPYDGKFVHGQRLGIESLDSLICTIKEKTLDELKSMPGLMPERAPVIFAGAVILQEIMNFLKCAEAIISDRGVRWGVFYEEFLKDF